ncbi:MAG: sulfotransferase [Acidimicrobiales bacterium]
MTPVTKRVIARVPERVLQLLPVELRADARDWLNLRVPGDVGYVVEPPRPNPGERPGPPDFLVLGGTDVGGRWWMSQLADHPGVAPNRTLDDAAHFFASSATERFGAEQGKAFHALFPRRPGRIIGHWSPDGLSYPWVVPLLAEAAPRAQVLVLVRDPIESLRARIAATVDDRPPHVGSNLADAVDRGFYGSQVAHLFEHYPPDQVRILQYERCVGDTAGSLADSFDFLGLDAGYHPRVVADPERSADGSADRLAPATAARLHSMYAADVTTLANMVPDLDLSLWSPFI